ncbi:MAG: hypothetical protein HZB09_02450 [Candidatus Yonathbacteria bacterium]|nr:hypothetical protein [Candidatus Yonathbacteria bacterium]
MAYKKISTVHFLTLFFVMLAGIVVPTQLLVAQTQDNTAKNVGFPARGVWYSKDSFFEGEEILIHVIAFNDAGGTFSGVMEFYDGSALLGKVPFSITDTQKVKVISLKWKATAGDHRISASITGAQLALSNGTVLALTLPSSKTSESPIFVDQDINHNAIGDSKEPQTVAVSSSTESQIFGRGVDMAKNVVPESVRKGTASTFSKIDDFRSQEHDLVAIARVDNIEQLDSLNQKETAALAGKASNTSGAKQAIATGTPQFGVSDHVERPLRYVYWAFLAIAETILAHSWIFYTILFIAVYLILRALWRRVRSAGV